MFFPEALYTLSARDHQVTWLDPFFQRSELNSASAALTAQFVVPEGRALILQHVYARQQPGAAQNLTSLQFQVEPQQPGFIVPLNREFALGAVVFSKLTWQGSLLLPPLWRVVCDAFWNAGANPNLLHFAAGGLLIPAGNVQRV